MFGKLKKKLKEWTEKVSEVEGEEEILEEPVEEVKEEKKKEIKKKKSSKKEKKKEEPKEDLKEEIIKTPTEEIEEKSDITTKEEKKGFFKKIFSKEEEVEEEPEEETKETEEIKEEPKEKTTKKSETKSTPSKKKETKPKEAKSEESTKPSTLKKPDRDSEGRAGTDKEEKKKETTEVKELELKEEHKEKPKPKKSSFFSKKKTISEEEFEDYSEDLEMILLENNVALEVTDKILEQLKDKIVDQELSKKEIQETIERTLKEIVEDVLVEPFDILEEIKAKDGPYVMIFCGINGVGKTTQIAKFAHMLKEKGITSVMAAGDTFRAAAVEQLQTHGKNLDIKVIAHDYGSDPASVGFDAIKYAKKNNIDVVFIDTAGRIHTATNLLQEMAKIKRVCNPDRTIFVGESITGNDAVDQVKAFNDNIGIDGIFLSKADIDEKGGTALSVGYVTKKPIIYLGTGQNYEDIEPFNKEAFIKKRGLGEE